MDEIKVDPDVLAQLNGNERDKYLESIERQQDLATQLKIEELKLAQQQQLLNERDRKEKLEQRAKYRGLGEIEVSRTHDGEVHVQRSDTYFIMAEGEAEYWHSRPDEEFIKYAHDKCDDIKRNQRPQAAPMPTKSRPLNPEDYSVQIDAGGKSVSEWADWGKGGSSDDRMDAAQYGPAGEDLDKIMRLRAAAQDKSQQPNNGPAWDPKKSRKREEDMANKFLPFVVESSTPHHIFKTLISRSKGMNKMLIASIFNLTLNVDIKKLRATVKEYPEMQVDKLYEELLTKYPSYRVSEDEINLFLGMSKYLPKITNDDEEPWLSQDLQSYPLNDALLFIAIVLKSDLELSEYTSLDFTSLVDIKPVMDKLSDFIIINDNDDNSLKVVVTDTKDLHMAVLYYALFWHQFQESDSVLLPHLSFKMKDQS